MDKPFVYRLPGSIDVDATSAAALSLFAEFPQAVTQLNLTYMPGTPAEGRLLRGTGKLQGSGLWERDFTEFEDRLRSGPLGAARDAIAALGFALGRIRLMRVRPRTCYSVHNDTSARIHIPLVTNEMALMIFPEQRHVVHFPADGGIWFTDTTLKHTAMNGGMATRVHFVAALAD
jgi:hypothetical protein